MVYDGSAASVVTVTVTESVSVTHTVEVADCSSFLAATVTPSARLALGTPAVAYRTARAQLLRTHPWLHAADARPASATAPRRRFQLSNISKEIMFDQCDVAGAVAFRWASWVGWGR